VNGYLLDKSSQSEIWVLGNGESRKTLNLKELEYTIGCNAVHREHVCNQIVAVDRRMVNEIISNPLYKDVPVYTRPDWVNNYKQYPNVGVVPSLPYTGTDRIDDPWHWNTGPFAILVACYMSPNKINLLGFDLYSTKNNLNNIYKDTQNYGKTTDRPVDHSYWVYHLKKIFDCFPSIEFVHWHTDDWVTPHEWLDTKNLTLSVISV
jgi:hypothetical protein